MQTVDPKVSKLKFEHEVSIFKKGEEVHRSRGIFLLNAEFPNIVLLFTAHQLQPAAIVFAVQINFDNYDLEPPSVRFIHPFTWQLLQQAPVGMPRKIAQANQPQPQFLNLVQQNKTSLPFICIPGIREYHNHPAHSGDSWLLHRNKGGEGSLGFIVDKLYEYGISAIQAFQIQLQLQVPKLVVAFDQKKIPE